MRIWDDTEIPPLFLLTPAEFANLPDGSILECIDGEKVVKGRDYIDMDTRYGHIAFGIRGKP